MKGNKVWDIEAKKKFSQYLIVIFFEVVKFNAC